MARRPAKDQRAKANQKEKMGASRKKGNRVRNGCVVGAVIASAFQAVEEDERTGPGAGLDAQSPFVTRLIEVGLDHVADNPTRETMVEVAAALGSILAGIHEVERISAKEFDRLREGLIVKLADVVDVEYGEDAYDLASAAFDEGASQPRTDLLDAEDRQKREAAERERNYRSKRRDSSDAVGNLDSEEAEEQRAADRTASILAALEATSEDAGALFEPHILAAAHTLRMSAPADYQRVLAKVRGHGAGLTKEWEAALRQYERVQREKEREREAEERLLRSSSAAKGGRTAEAVEEDEEEGEPLPSETAHEYGTDAAFDPLNEFMRSTLFRLLNRDNKVVGVGGDVRVLELTADGKVILHRPDALRKKFENVRIPVPDRKSPVNAFDAWMQWPDRSTQDGLGFYPGSPKHPAIVPPNHFNMWRGYAVEPTKGKWPLLHAHMLEVYCGGDEELLCWLLDWVAQMLQEPQRKPGTSVVFRSRTEGTGKSLFAHVMGRVIGSAVLSASRSDQVAGRFNSHLQNCLLLVAEEAVYAGSKQASGILKDLVTCSSMGYEAKGLPVVTAPNYTRVLFISNEAHVVPAGPTSRRFAVFDCENPRAGDRKYFDPLFAEIDNGGAEAFLHDMLERKIASDLRSPPITKALLEQREATLDGFGKWLLSAAQDGQLVVPDRDGSRIIDLHVAIDLGAAVSSEDLRASLKPYLDPYESRSIDYKLGRLLQEVGAVKRRLKERGRPYGYEFPPLADFRVAVAQRLGVDVKPLADARASKAHAPISAKVVDLHTVRRAANDLRRSIR